MTTLHDFGGVLGRPLDTFFWALTIPWSRFVCEVALIVLTSGPLAKVCQGQRGQWAYGLSEAQTATL